MQIILGVGMAYVSDLSYQVFFEYTRPLIYLADWLHFLAVGGTIALLTWLLTSTPWDGLGGCVVMFGWLMAISIWGWNTPDTALGMVVTSLPWLGRILLGFVVMVVLLRWWDRRRVPETGRFGGIESEEVPRYRKP